MLKPQTTNAGIPSYNASRSARFVGLIAVSLVFMAQLACSSGSSTPGTGGSKGSGTGGSATGGHPSTGGTNGATGGTVGSGGTSGSGGATGSGGVVSTGGTSTGGATGTGGGPASGGATASGGSAGGSTAAGGAGGAAAGGAGGKAAPPKALVDACTAACKNQTALACADPDCVNSCVSAADFTASTTGKTCNTEYLAMMQCTSKLAANKWMCNDCGVAEVVDGSCTTTVCPWACCVTDLYAGTDIWNRCETTCPP